MADHTENQWVTCFQESAEALLGVSANELGDWKTNVSLSGKNSYMIGLR